MLKKLWLEDGGKVAFLASIEDTKDQSFSENFHVKLGSPLDVKVESIDVKIPLSSSQVEPKPFGTVQIFENRRSFLNSSLRSIDSDPIIGQVKDTEFDSAGNFNGFIQPAVRSGVPEVRYPPRRLSPLPHSVNLDSSEASILPVNPRNAGPSVIAGPSGIPGQLFFPSSPVEPPLSDSSFSSDSSASPSPSAHQALPVQPNPPSSPIPSVNQGLSEISGPFVNPFGVVNVADPHDDLLFYMRENDKTGYEITLNQLYPETKKFRIPKGYKVIRCGVVDDNPTTVKECRNAMREFFWHQRISCMIMMTGVYSRQDYWQARGHCSIKFLKHSATVNEDGRKFCIYLMKETGRVFVYSNIEDRFDHVAITSRRPYVAKEFDEAVKKGFRGNSDGIMALIYRMHLAENFHPGSFLY